MAREGECPTPRIEVEGNDLVDSLVDNEDAVGRTGSRGQDAAHIDMDERGALALKLGESFRRDDTAGRVKGMDREQAARYQRRRFRADIETPDDEGEATIGGEGDRFGSEGRISVLEKAGPLSRCRPHDRNETRAADLGDGDVAAIGRECHAVECTHGRAAADPLPRTGQERFRIDGIEGNTDVLGQRMADREQLPVRRDAHALGRRNSLGDLVQKLKPRPAFVPGRHDDRNDRSADVRRRD